MIQELRKKAKRFLLKSTGAVSHLKKTAICKHEWYGNEYGGFYIHPTILDSKSVVYSFGLGMDISFDKAMIENHQCTVVGFDPTPKSLNWLEKQDLPKGFSYLPYGIGPKTEEVTFYLPANENHVSGSMVQHGNINENRKVEVQMKSIEDILAELRHEKIDVLKMDIEGSEYDVIDAILNSGISINQLLIEFHDRFYEDGRKRTINAIKSLEYAGYGIFGVSGSFEEVSFIKKSLISS